MVRRVLQLHMQFYGDNLMGVMKRAAEAGLSIGAGRMGGRVLGAMPHLRGVGTVLTGDKRVDAKLRHLSHAGSKRAITAGIRASMAVMRKALRAAINASDAEPELKKAARESIGSRFSKKKRETQRNAVVGFSVGKRTGSGAKMLPARDGQPGVGIDHRNIHWFVLGTTVRHTKGEGQRIRKKAHRGSIEPIFGDVTSEALISSGGAAIAAARQAIKAAIAIEAKKQG